MHTHALARVGSSLVSSVRPSTHASALVVGLLTVALAACGKAAAPAPAAEPTKAEAAAEPAAAPAAEPTAGDDPHASRTEHVRQPGHSLPFTLVVALDPAAQAMMKAKGEAIAVDVTVDDGIPGDDGGYRRHEVELPGDGGIVEVPGLDLSPVKERRALTNFSITVSSARKSGPTNLLACDASSGAVDTLLPRMVINCKRL